MDLRECVLEKDREIARLRMELHDARQAGIAMGVLLARTPGWTEVEAADHWERACAELASDGRIAALASYVVQTGHLPGEGEPAPPPPS